MERKSKGKRQISKGKRKENKGQKANYGAKMSRTFLAFPNLTFVFLLLPFAF
jgi:hypothetical protein